MGLIGERGWGSGGRFVVADVSESDYQHDSI